MRRPSPNSSHFAAAAERSSGLTTSRARPRPGAELRVRATICISTFSPRPLCFTSAGGGGGAPESPDAPAAPTPTGHSGRARGRRSRDVLGEPAGLMDGAPACSSRPLEFRPICAAGRARIWPGGRLAPVSRLQASRLGQSARSRLSAPAAVAGGKVGARQSQAATNGNRLASAASVSMINQPARAAQFVAPHLPMDSARVGALAPAPVQPSPNQHQRAASRSKPPVATTH